MKLDIASLGGIVVGALALIAGFAIDGGKVGSLLQLTAAIIVFGGTFAATFTSFSLAAMRRVPQHLAVVFRTTSFDPVTLIDELCAAATAYKKADGGFKELEARAGSVPDRFVAKGYRLIADGKTGDELRERLETDLWAEHEGLQEGARIFSTAGGYAPTMGIAGTVMGLIRVLSLLNGSMTSLGSAIGLAFIATLYGVGSANIVWLPLSTNLKTKASQILLMRQIALDGLLGIGEKLSQSALRPVLLAHIEATLPDAGRALHTPPAQAKSTG